MFLSLLKRLDLNNKNKCNKRDHNMCTCEEVKFPSKTPSQTKKFKLLRRQSAAHTLYKVQNSCPLVKKILDYTKSYYNKFDKILDRVEDSSFPSEKEGNLFTTHFLLYSDRQRMPF